MTFRAALLIASAGMSRLRVIAGDMYDMSLPPITASLPGRLVRYTDHDGCAP